MSHRMLTTTAVALALMLPMAVRAQLSASTSLAIARGATDAMPCHATSARLDGRAVQCFVEVDGEADYDRLRAMGVSIDSRFGSLATARVPAALLPLLRGVAGLRRVAVAQSLVLANDTARAVANADAAHLGFDLPQAYSGKGVVLGIIDTGVDFGHINFRDSTGRCRISRVYLPHDTTGRAPVIAGDTLPGSHYDTPQDIAALTTDTRTMHHGSHTLGTAAGSHMASGYHGVAPEADLVVCAMPEIYDADVANSIKYILHYADSVGRPAVVSMSFSSHEGAHNGTSPLCKVLDSASGPGRVMVIAAGNDARCRMYLEHLFDRPETDTVRTYIDNYYASDRYSGYVSVWSATATPHRIGLTVIDRASHRQVAELPMFELSDSAATLTLDSIPALAPYFTGEALYASELDPNGQFHSVVQLDAKPTASNYRLGLQLVADGADTLRAWSSGIIMINDAAVPGYTAAVRNSCISDLATGERAISVGAWCSRDLVPTPDGGTRTIARCTPPDIAYFSSYGPDARGLARPDVCAPGMALVSSGNRYCDNMAASCDVVHTADGDYPYISSSGTSMATPFTAGTIALWLQACPTLTPAQVRLTLAATALRDAYVEAAPMLWGAGKIDTAGGLRHVIAHYALQGDVNGDGLVDIDDANTLINVILGRISDPAITARADIDSSGLTDIEDVNALINLILRRN